MKVESPDLALDGRPAVSMLELYTSVWRFAAGGRASVGSQTIKLLVPWLTAQASDTESQFLYLQNLVNVIGPLVALTIMSAWVGALAAIGYIAVAVVIVHFDRRLMRLRVRATARRASRHVHHRFDSSPERTDLFQSGNRHD